MAPLQALQHRAGALQQQIMKRYLAKLVFSISIQGQQCSEFDEQLRLVEAVDLPEALQEAKKIGADAQETFTNQHGAAINWSFMAVTELIPFQNLHNGMEIYSHIREKMDAQAYTKYIQRQADLLECRFSFQKASV